MDKYGYVTFVGRLKDLVIRGGENICPREIEDFLHQNPKIVDVYVVGVPDKRMGEELCACIKLAHNETMTGEELKLFCKDKVKTISFKLFKYYLIEFNSKKIAHFKIPKYVEFMNDFPMTVTGKIQKNILREILTKKLGL